MTPQDRILLLDVDGVLVTPPDWYGARLRQESPAEAAEFFGGPFLAASRGEIDLKDHLAPFIASLGRTDAPEAFLAEWHESENHPNLPLWEVVRVLRSEGWRIHLATNQERHRMRHLMEKTGLDALVDGEYASCTVGHRKPTHEYFAEVTRRLGVSPERIVFFDDAEENVAAARRAGWEAYVYQDLDGFVKDLYKNV